jgi:hypothetical protein
MDADNVDVKTSTSTGPTPKHDPAVFLEALLMLQVTI